ncbi:MAG TPA: hypothetical protein VN900_13775, partial [Stellaceae bacterium]|nr:hypothetical protein [Stellaceae bacterium]
SGGYPAMGPSSLSSFDALDAVLTKLANRTILPNLATVVIAGFSAGGQVLQRYAIVGRGEAAFGATPIHLRYVVGSPSSYAYFTDDRPRPDGSIGPFAAAGCPDFNHWKYGFAANLPPYAAAAAALGVSGLARRYAARDVAYLVGSNDTDPNHRFLDKSCAGEAQGPNRLARMQFFFAELKLSEGGTLKHWMSVIDGAAHNEARVLGSPCGRAALFGDANCPDQQETK